MSGGVFSTGRRAVGLVAGLATGLAASGVGGEPTVNTYGLPGLVETPTAEALPDGDLRVTVSDFGPNLRTTLAFQAFPRLTGTFRYSVIEGFVSGAQNDRFDRSFDFQYRFIDETDRLPAVAVGVRDIGGTGLLASEYVVASKNFLGDRLLVSGGLGWGRLGSQNGFTNPLGILGERFETRPRRSGGIAATGQLDINEWFRGDAAIFGGLRYKVSDQLMVMAEYSSDAYADEVGRGLITRDSSINFGATYRFRNGVDVSAQYLYGTEAGVMVSFPLRPYAPRNGSGLDAGGQAVQPRPDRRADPGAWNTDWVNDPASRPVLESNLVQALAQEGLEMEGYKLSARSAELRFRNPIYLQTAQAVGRAARSMTRALPASVEQFVLVPINEQGLAGTVITLRRSDLEALEHAPDGAWQSYVRAQIDDAAGLSDAGLLVPDGIYPRFTWGLGPYTAASFFDPDNPVRVDLGAELSARFEPRPGLVFSGALQQRIVGNRDESTRVNNSILPPVRSDANLYAQADGPTLPYLTAEYFFRPRSNFYGRLSFGMLEPMYAGISGELLWKPPQGRLALGVELNHVKQRDFDQQFDFRDLSANTGHVSAYYRLDNGYHAQLDVGRYLATDTGATFSLFREFRNGWRVGGYFTLTDVSFEDFGEGSFDKALVIEIPTNWVIGTPNRSRQSLTIQPVLRDGGARLDVRNRLYELVRDQSNPDLADGWDRFWR